MILEFSITNFLSFKDKTTFSMLANNTKGLDNNYIISNDRKILKTSVIYGANASGKSNIFKVLSTVILMLRNSNNTNIFAKLPIVPFKFSKDSLTKPSEFEIKFIINNIRYVYGFKLDSQKIYEEYLYYYPKGRETKIFDRINDNYTYAKKDSKILKELVKKNASNKFFLATSTNWNFEKTKLAYDFLTNNIGVYFNIEDLKREAFNIYEKNDHKLKAFVLDFLKKTDFNISDYKISKIDIPPELLTNIPDFLKKDTLEKPKAFQILFKHMGVDNYLSFDEESMGTQMAFLLAPFISASLNEQKVLVIDELDKSLHPFLVQYIVNIFNSKKSTNNSQLIFNTHDTNLLDLNILRRDQIWFTEKDNDNGESTLYSLSDFAVRKLENIEKGYMLGKFGAVPFIKNEWNLWEEE